METRVPYCGMPPMPEHWLSQWNADPWLIAALVGGFCYGMFLSRGTRQQRSFLFAWLLAVLLFVSPLCALASALFAVRALHHVVIVAAIAPLLALAFPARRAAPAAAPFVVATLVLWSWHVPDFYAEALGNAALYWAMQLSLLGSALWLWRRLLAPDAAPLPALVTIASTLGQMGLLGALLTFAPAPLYAQHWLPPLAYGVSALEDQQLAGLLMWVPAMVPYLLLGRVVLARLWARTAAS